MAKLIGGTRVYGSLTTDAALISPAGSGFMNIVTFTTGTVVSYTLPSVLQYAGAKFKATIIGGGGSGGGTAITAGQMGGGGGSGAVYILYLTVASGVYSLNYTIAPLTAAAAAGAAGSAGNASILTYNGISYTASGGGGGSLATNSTAGGLGGTFTPVASTNQFGINGNQGGAGGVMSATTNVAGLGANTPLGWGQGGVMPETAAGQAGQPGAGYGSGGSGARNGTGAATTRAGGTGAPGLIIIEY
jgi:hypothetical protein